MTKMFYSPYGYIGVMTIRNPDGSPYKPTGTLTQFDPDNPEFELFNSLDQEIIEMGGTPDHVLRGVSSTSSNIDELYVEARDKLWSEHPICLSGYYDPIPSQNAMGAFRHRLAR
jgi:hypothetical protein